MRIPEFSADRVLVNAKPYPARIIPDESRGGVLMQAFARRSVEASGPFSGSCECWPGACCCILCWYDRCTIWCWGTLESAL